MNMNVMGPGMTFTPSPKMLRWIKVYQAASRLRKHVSFDVEHNRYVLVSMKKVRPSA